MQANASVLTSCDDWARAVRDARRERKALLLLVRREAGEMPLVLAQATWERAVAVAPAVPPSRRRPRGPPVPATIRRCRRPPAARGGARHAAARGGPRRARPHAAAPAAARAPAPRRAAERRRDREGAAAAGAPAAPLDEVLRALETLAPEEPTRARIGTYQQQLLRVHRQIESLAARGDASPQVITGLRTVVRYYDAAEVAWEADEEHRERDKRPRHIPSSEGTAAPYFVDSDAEATILEFPFLRSTVVREPGTAIIEVSGLWRPVQARALLWEKGREQLGRLAEWVRAGR